ncbi:hypothetical protein B5X24_HaOG208949 [Helicoverpa armigera]|uniref:Uncharacterized protein n=1 Tax=Helicoverpa armigera TaxID=29058 RepID=A0A2W1BJ45_HELAM|nr:hypothetical protein B5X24_HaOG208949 [Helicoverpa armigera]
MQPPLQRRRLRGPRPPRPAPRTPHPAPRAPRRRVRIPPSVERREASRLRNLRRRIPFIATRDSINTACDRCGSLAARPASRGPRLPGMGKRAQFLKF